MKPRTLLAALALAAVATVSHAAETRSSPPSTATVLVVGATGRSGPALLEALRAGGYTRVRALVRDPACARAKVAAGVELAQGDVRDPASLAKALDGVQYVVSALGITNPNNPLNRFGKVMEWKLKGENALRTSGVPYTIVRPGGVLQAAETRSLTRLRLALSPVERVVHGWRRPQPEEALARRCL